MRPLVSILTPTYNQEHYVSRCIESVLAQTFPDWEMLVVDDGSEDGTPDRVASYRDERVILLRQEHVGIWRLRETYGRALARARGSLLAILDGDDWWPGRKLEIQTAAFRDDAVAMSYGAVDFHDGAGSRTARGDVPGPAAGGIPGQALIALILRGRFLPYSVTVMVRKAAIDGIGGFVQPADMPLVDVPTWLRVALGRRCFGFRDVLGCYRVHSGSVCRALSPEIEEGHMRLLEEFLDANWRQIGLGENQWRATRRALQADHSHRRAFRRACGGERREALRLFGRAFLLGDGARKLKAGARIVQTLLSVRQR